MEEKIKFSFSKLLSWVNQNGWKGYDPYDLKSKKWLVYLIKKSKDNFFLRVLKITTLEFIQHFPKFSRRLFFIKKEFNPKGIALIADAFLTLYQLEKKQEYLDKSTEGLELLLSLKVEVNNGYGWGYPFDWQSKAFIPRNTPNGIVTTAVGALFWNWYIFSKDPKYLKICEKIATFLCALPQTKFEEDKICFAYTPIFVNYVHNLNLFIAEFLIKVGQATNKREWVNIGVKATNYTIQDQLEDGSFEYEGPPVPRRLYIDNYHTGFVMRMLFSIWKCTNNPAVFSALKRCHHHYLHHFFEENGIPKLTPYSTYRIDIHSASEAIYCLSVLNEVFPNSKAQAASVLNWTIDNMQDNSGYFYHAIFKNRFTGKAYTSKIAYLRWGQGWMFTAFSQYFKLLKNEA